MVIGDIVTLEMVAVDTVTMNTAIKFTNTKDLMIVNMVLKDTIIKITHIVSLDYSQDLLLGDLNN